METVKVPSSDGIHTLSGRLYLPDGEIKGLFHIVHGMTEHIARYDRFMQDMCKQGFAVFGYDNLGHGYTADNEKELGFIAEKDGYKYLYRDVKVFSDAMRKRLGRELPYILMGHSMGSFIVRSAVINGTDPDMLIIMGTGGPNPAASFGAALAKSIKKRKGSHYHSEKLDRMIFGNYSSRFDPNDPTSWISTDKETLKKYAHDPFCTFKFTVSATEDLIRLNMLANSAKWYREIDKKMPILLVSGGDDPVGDYGKGVKKVYKRLIKSGANAELGIFEGFRHEILNDFSYDDVLKTISGFVNGNIR